MAIESLVTDSRAGLLNSPRPNNVGAGQQQNLLDQSKEGNKDKDYRSSEASAQRSDNISLSRNALDVISNREAQKAANDFRTDPAFEQPARSQASNDFNNLDFSQRLKRTQDLAVEIRGIEEFAKNNTLSESQLLRVESIRSELSNLLDNYATDIVNQLSLRVG